MALLNITSEEAARQVQHVLSRCIKNEVTGCMEWQGSKCRGGYGSLNFKSKTFNVHRLMWILVNGDVPDGIHVLHHCDNRQCCELSHLFLGTQKDNMQDASRKGRTRSGPKLHPECVQSGVDHWTTRIKDRIASGERNGMAKLSQETVDEIRRRKLLGDCTQRSLATEFGVSEATVSLIVNGKHWKQ